MFDLYFGCRRGGIRAALQPIWRVRRKSQGFVTGLGIEYAANRGMIADGRRAMHLKPALFALMLSSASAAISVPPSMDGTYMSARPIYSQPIWHPETVYPVERASRQFGHCVTRGMRGIDAAMAADAAAASLVTACAAQLRDLQQEAERVIAAAPWPEARKNLARTELRARFDQVEQRVAFRISQARLRTASR